MGTQLKIHELISEIEKKDYILPEFQRGYVWNREQVKEYLASLYRGYPTGSFLIWKTPNPGLVRGGAPDNDGGSFQLILDGQQRLTSIYTLVKGEPPPFYEGEKLYFDIWFNVQTEQFSYFKALEMKGHPEWIAVTPFLKAGIGNYLSAGNGFLAADEVAFLFQFFDRLNRLDTIKNYVYYLDVVTEREMDQVVKIFNLVNKQGTPLSKSDLALSHICALWPEARQEMRSLQAALKAEGFAFDLSFYVRCASAVATNAGTYEPLYRESVEAIKSAWQRARKAIEYLLNILRHDAYIDSSNALVSDNVLVPLVVYLANVAGKFKDDREKNRFLHWMYLALIWARYSGSTETALQQDIEALKDADPTTRLRANIVAQRGRTKVEARDLFNASTRTAWSTLAYVVARNRGARDWFNGQPLYAKNIGKSNGLEYHHIFNQDMLYKSGRYDSSSPQDRLRVNEIANIAYLTSAANKEVSNKPPGQYLPDVVKRYPDALRQQVVPEQPALWQLERYEDFLAHRRQMLADAMNAYLDGLLADEKPADVSIEDYIAAGEGESVEFKGSLRWDYRQGTVNKTLEKMVARTLAAFMNSKGGTLIIGVSDEGDALGLEADFATLQHRPNADGWEQHLHNVLNSYLGKDVAATVSMSFGEFQGKAVAVVRAEPGIKPVFLTDGPNTEFFIRAGNTTQLLNVKETTEYIKQHFAAVA
jgi:hypothetical protein